eukprot:TRINITY_DN7435_c0_g1_i1.p1 TRINITY_DN7435_c0_g1~~TRINITY_DN7435_c0_g1_i1.p1  ORF type:complete len:416 (-),score=33.97 TRINITY_DN7435_c0_g1_i1:16-1263(-)
MHLDSSSHSFHSSVSSDDDLYGPKPKKCCGKSLSLGAFKEVQIMILLLMVIASGGINRVASKIMTVPMGDYSFFLGLFNAFMYVFLYGSILAVRIAIGAVPFEQLRWAWGGYISRVEPGEKRPWYKQASPMFYFIVMGLMDGLGNVTGLIATPHISGPMQSLMSQSILIFSILSCLIILRTKYTYWQVWGAFLVLCGATVSLIPTLMGDSGQTDLGFALLMAASTLPNAISFTLKELVFDLREDDGLDVFIVNTHASLFQLLLQPIFLPLSVLLGVTGTQSLPNYISNGFSCFVGITPIVSTLPCEYNPYPYLVYICVNLTFNILLLFLVKKASSLLSFMAIKAILPISVVLFYFKLPLLEPTKFSPYTIAGLIIILTGLVLYRITTIIKMKYNLTCCSVYLPFGSGNNKYRTIQ